MSTQTAIQIHFHLPRRSFGHTFNLLILLSLGLALELPKQALAAQQPAAQSPAAQSPTVQQPAIQQPAIQQPGFQQPGFQQPAVQQPGFQQPAVQQSGFQQPAVPSPTAGAQQSPAPRRPSAGNPGNGTNNPAPSAIGSPATKTPRGNTVTNRSSAPGVSTQRQEPVVTRITRSLDKLPNSAGQIWQEYDISSYTSEIKSTSDPQKAITQWILRETGTEMWFNQPMGILSADKDRLYVYHSPEIQAVVKGIVDRFVHTRGQIQNIDVNLVTVDNPNWRAQSYTMLQPIEVKSPGVEAWMISKENAAILMGQLNRRGDFKQHSGGRLTNHDGQTLVLEKKQPVQFVRSLRWIPNQVPHFQPLMTSVNEGYRLAISSLSSINNGSIEAVIQCEVDQVEKLSTVRVDVPGMNGVSQQVNLQIPQLVSWRLHERFRWPNDQVLLLSCGVVASPEPDNRTQGFSLPGFSPKPKRSDALMFIEYRGPASDTMMPQSAASRLAPIQR